MKNVMSKEKLIAVSKQAINYVVVVGLITASFGIGNYMGKNQSIKKEVATNPYAHAFSPEEISIAVNESSELIMIERTTGKYIVYSDEIGKTIFSMYVNRIKQEGNDIK
jgi:RPA family protein